MNNIFKYNLQFFKNYKKTKSFIIIMIISLLLNVTMSIVYAMNMPEKIGYLELIISIISSRQVILFNIMIFLINSYYVHRLINSIYFNSRFVTVDNSFKNQLYIIFFQNLFLYIYILLSILIAVGLVNNSNHGIYYLESKGTYNIVYFIFFMAKYYIIIQLFCLFSIIITNKVNEIISLIMTLSYLMYIFFDETIIESDYIVSGIQNIGLRFSYLLMNIKYNGFVFEILINLLYIMILFGIIKIITSKQFELFTKKIRRKKYEN